ncbi:hypothetical protein GCM10009105_14320 [Dokdonella soli]|uniref:Calcineurin-like phosphoesterase domain-containing protein n=1 Tax=Dokdonella soli TaxID=529810 RepID=A0ABN1IFM3_9GAMM
MNDDSHHDHAIDRRHFLECMAWAGTGAFWMMRSGIPAAHALDVLGPESKATARDASFSFVQISDSHIGFNKAPNADVVGSLRQSIAHINALPERPDFIIHTGDLSHLSRPEEFDTVA